MKFRLENCHRVNKILFCGPEMDEVFQKFFLVLKDKIIVFEDVNNSDLNIMNQLSNFTDILQGYESLKNTISDEHAKYLDQRYTLAGTQLKEDNQNTIVPTLTSALSNFIVCLNMQQNVTSSFQ